MRPSGPIATCSGCENPSSRIAVVLVQSSASSTMTRSFSESATYVRPCTSRAMPLGRLKPAREPSHEIVAAPCVAESSTMRLLFASATRTLPLTGSIATPRGWLNCPTPVPLVPNVVIRSRLAASYTLMRLLLVSASHIVPSEGLAAIAYGQLNRSVEPVVGGIFATKSQSAEKTCTLLCFVSATQMFPVAGSTATPRGQLNDPFSQPRLPHHGAEPKGSSAPVIGSIFTTRWLTPSIASMLP